MIQGILFDGHTSNGQKVVLTCDAEGHISIQDTDHPVLHFSALKISPRIGQTPRYLTFPDGSQFESEDNDAIDALLVQWQPSASLIQRLLHQLESHQRVIAFSVLFLATLGWGLIQYGIPYLSQELALAAPVKVSQWLGDGVLKSIEKVWLEDSTLREEKQIELETQFNALTPNEELDWRLLLRKGGILGANAFALPNGTIVMTDELVRVAHNNEQLISIMAHEVGHVLHRHGLRTVIQKSSLALLVMLISGDVSSSSSIMTALPAVLVEAGYSQAMEWEADSYALDYLRQQGIDPMEFANIMHLLEHQQSATACQKADKMLGKQLPSAEKSDCATDTTQQSPMVESPPEVHETSLGDYFSTHPPTQVRIERFRQASMQNN